MVFRRRHQRAEPEIEYAADREPEPEPTESARRGPWDEADLASPRDGRIDLGGLLIPVVQGMQVGLETTDNRVVAVRLQIGDGVLQLTALAAPRSAGIWDEVRAEIAADIAKHGGTTDEATGPFGTELRATLPGRVRDGRKGTQRARFMGVDGPRWLLRGVMTGQAATDPHHAGLLENVFREVVVVRGKDPIAPRDLIPLRLPQNARTEQAHQEPDAGPLPRGQQISEAG